MKPRDTDIAKRHNLGGITRVAPADWRANCALAHTGGERFEGLFATARDGRTVELRAVFSSRGSASA